MSVHPAWGARGYRHGWAAASGQRKVRFDQSEPPSPIPQAVWPRQPSARSRSKPAAPRRQVPAVSKCGLQAVAVAAVALAVAGWSPAAHAAGLFLPVADKEAAVAASASGGFSPAVVWERRVRVLHHELAGVRANVQAGDTGRLLLNIRPGVALDVAVERTAPTKWGYSLSGRIEGGQIGFATLVVHEGAVAGTIWTPDAAYEVSYLGGGVHAIRDVTNAPRAECAGAVPTE